MNTPILTVNQLSIQSKERVLFQDIQFEVNAGEMLAVMGPSGIGKSMLSKAIAGFTPDSMSVSGDIFLAGANVCNVSLIERAPEQRPAFIFQDALQALNPLVTVEAQLTLAHTGWRTKPKTDDRSTIAALLTRLGFSDPSEILKLYPSQLSGGQRQRICIAIGLLSKASLLIADEPTSALDPVTEQEILTLIRESVRNTNMAGILITHDLHSALECDKMVVIDEGRVIAYGEPRHALECSEHDFCQSLRGLI
ncbi:ABC transporter ATP-binding protein [Vibrio sp. SCSIO 43140]|uniref:ATP-binding cassette domain-containing protein n=1 Tax=Vibrio sp. SCSIO 43140 TaxID=2819100 RepID=UPI0020757574|nr:ATP-binding cassette domain-containing protein [Vibrio sp. SCSIO 43140]USD61378.1 ABC transporter ATP-binding protein [Vibrio sp. SCSIO 43140]